MQNDTTGANNEKKKMLRYSTIKFNIAPDYCVNDIPFPGMLMCCMTCVRTSGYI